MSRDFTGLLASFSISHLKVPSHLEDVRPQFYLPRGAGNRRYLVPATLAQDEENYHLPDEEAQPNPILLPPPSLLPPFAPDRPTEAPAREPLVIADRIPSSQVDLTDNYLRKQYTYSFATPEPIKTTWAPEAPYRYSHTTEVPRPYATEPAIPSQQPPETLDVPNFYSYTRYSHGKPQAHGVWTPSPPFRDHNARPPHRIPRRRAGGRGGWGRPWSRRRWWQNHRRRVPSSWMQRRGDHYRNQRLEADFGEHRISGRRNHRRLHPPFGQRRMEPGNHDYEWESEDPPMDSRWDVGSPHEGGHLGRPGWGAPGWHRGWLPPPHDRQGPGEARRGEPQYRGMIRVDGWSSPRVLDSMLGVSTFLQNQIMDSYYLQKNIRGIWKLFGI